jgi:hypothetical protein
MIVMLDPLTRAARYLPRFSIAYMAGGEGAFAVPLGGTRFLLLHPAQDVLRRELAVSGLAAVTEEPLGNLQIANVETTGHRVTMRIPAGYRGHSKPIELVDERWESRDLKLLISAHISDTRAGELDYLVTNIRRVEPPPDLFVVPPDHSFGPIDPGFASFGPPANDPNCGGIRYIPAVIIRPGRSLLLLKGCSP